MNIPFLHQAGIQLQPQAIDDDDLSQAIMADADVHDDNWQLTETPDTEQLEAYWQNVEQDLHRDPGWTDFTE